MPVSITFDAAERFVSIRSLGTVASSERHKVVYAIINNQSIAVGTNVLYDLSELAGSPSAHDQEQLSTILNVLTYKLNGRVAIACTNAALNAFCRLIASTADMGRDRIRVFEEKQAAKDWLAEA
ncbi:MAG: hypothetical protein U0892_14820 [Pirellulales bacterium]